MVMIGLDVSGLGGLGKGTPSVPPGTVLPIHSVQTPLLYDRNRIYYEFAQTLGRGSESGDLQNSGKIREARFL